jgi:hypothetical protein
MMKKFMILAVLLAIFVACDYAKESLKNRPDVEVVFITPLGYYIVPGELPELMGIDTLKFVANNSVDSYLREVIWEYVDTEGNTFYTGDPFALYVKLEGLVNNVAIDTAKILNLGLPLLPAFNYLIDPSTPNAARAYLHFIFESEYDPEQTDTCDTWYGIYLVAP